MGTVLTWKGQNELRRRQRGPRRGFDANKACDDKTDDMFWVWGANNVAWHQG